ncbi:MAG: carboxypeptidase regulatory-like domain-containing protein [Bacteroidetes bacterium]|nr:carboxypeptidase regulatory-like domain-containing protein [Bacteroidota bacterium]
MKRILTLLGFLAGFFVAHAQNGEISGKILDENGEGMISAKVEIIDSKGEFTGRGAITDFDGNYALKPLTPGRYNVRVSFMGYKTYIQSGIIVNADKATFIDVKLSLVGVDKDAVEIIAYKKPLIDPGNTSGGEVVSSEQIKQNASRNVSDLVASGAGIVQSDQGGGINIGGQRGEGTQYYVDGVKVIGSPSLPASSIEQIQVITGGVPAKYGDLTGGIINITTKGPSGTWNGGAEYLTSQGLDAGGYNLVNANVTGPIWKEKKTKKTILGIFLAAEYLGQKDGDPSAVGVWKIRPDVLDSLRRSPLQKKLTETGFNLSSDNITYKDMYKVKTKDNVYSHNFKGNARIDLRPADNFTLSFGGTVAHNRYHSWVEEYQLFNTENNPYFKDMNYRVYGRFTHTIQSKTSDDDKKKASAFQNAYYMVQVDYEKYYQTNGDDSHGFNAFDYGHIGKFETRRSPTFEFNTFVDTITNQNFRGFIQNGNGDTAVLFTPGTLNPFGTRYTQQYYELLGAQPDQNGRYEVYGDNNANFTSNLDQIQANQALINGTRSNVVNNIWFNTGRQYNGFGVGADNDQYRVRLEGSFDILKPGSASRNKHNFEFGVEYEQRINRYYSVSPLALWQRARALANKHLTELDRANPVLRINGVNYTYDDLNRPNFYVTDTILFNRLYKASDQAFFDKSLRKSLQLAENGTDWIDVDALDPSQLNIKMFSPEELLQDGASLVGYRGYDQYGNKYSKQPSWNDFFTKRRADGELERAIPAFRPVYAAAYLSDRFYFKDLTFNVGVRVDRFDANEKVLKDPYSLYPIYTASEVTRIGNNDVSHPANIGSDYYVYVDNTKAQEPGYITGYRNGNTWYDRFGNELASGNSLALASATGSIQPYLKGQSRDIKDPNTFDPNGTFKDYTPQIVVMPRLQFSFNLTDKALFFAHYDVLSQRPTGQVITDPTQWLYFENSVGGVFNNAGLKPVKTIDFELGFKQVVSKTSAVTISAVYREFRDLIQVRKIINAYPKDYITFDNIDFGTYKAIKLDFDMRRTGNFTLKANYTLSFAEGTGSDAGTQFNIINGGQPNFRSINYLNFDARHVINATAAYSYGSGKDYNGPVIKNSQILSNSGISLQVAGRSGTPYTAQQNATPNALQGQPGRPISEGTINGSRLPWYFRLNLKVWKDFSFRVGNKETKKSDKRELSFQVYVQIQNLLDSRNVVGLYRYTGTPNDDGYLSDPASSPTIQAALNPQAFKDQYAAYINRPSNYSVPRRIFLGGLFSF